MITWLQTVCKWKRKSVEDQGQGICFNVYVYNSQPGVTIDYATGESWPSDTEQPEDGQAATYILNTSSHKFHKPDCGSVNAISPANKKRYTGDRADLIEQGLSALRDL